MSENFGIGHPDFGDAVGGRDEQIRFIDIDLSVARSKALGTMVELYMAGVFLFVAQDAFDSDTVISATKTVGKAFARINSNTNSPIYLRSGQQFQLGPFERLYIENPAQASKMMRLYFSTGPLILPFSSDVSVSGAVQVIDSYANEGASGFDVSPGGAGVTTIVTPAANVNGLAIRNAEVISSANLRLYADTSAPASDADTTKRSLIAASGNFVVLPYPMKLAAGVGLYLASSVAGGRGSGTYDLL